MSSVEAASMRLQYSRTCYGVCALIWCCIGCMSYAYVCRFLYNSHPRIYSRLVWTMFLGLQVVGGTLSRLRPPHHDADTALTIIIGRDIQHKQLSQSSMFLKKLSSRRLQKKTDTTAAHLRTSSWPEMPHESIRTQDGLGVVTDMLSMRDTYEYMRQRDASTSTLVSCSSSNSICSIQSTATECGTRTFKDRRPVLLSSSRVEYEKNSKPVGPLCWVCKELHLLNVPVLFRLAALLTMAILPIIVPILLGYLLLRIVRRIGARFRRSQPTHKFRLPCVIRNLHDEWCGFHQGTRRLPYLLALGILMQQPEHRFYKPSRKTRRTKKD